MAWIVKDAVTVVVVYNVITRPEPVHTDVTQGCTEINVIKVMHHNKNSSVTRAFRISQVMDRAVLPPQWSLAPNKDSSGNGEIPICMYGDT